MPILDELLDLTHIGMATTIGIAPKRLAYFCLLDNPRHPFLHCHAISTHDLEGNLLKQRICAVLLRHLFDTRAEVEDHVLCELRFAILVAGALATSVGKLHLAWRQKDKGGVLGRKVEEQGLALPIENQMFQNRARSLKMDRVTPFPRPSLRPHSRLRPAVSLLMAI